MQGIGFRVQGSGVRVRGVSKPFVVCGVLYLCAAVVVALLRFSTPFERGWWLVAYLSLVGGISQLLLGPGLIAIARRAAVSASDVVVPTSNAQLVLWNVGTLIVAVASMVRILIGVPLGSLLLFGALALFAAGQREVQNVADADTLPRLRAYTVLRWFLVLSVIVGNLLAYRGAGT